MKVTRNAVKTGKVDKGIGLYLVIDDDFEQMLRVARTSDAKFMVDIMINYKGYIRTYTLSEFLQKLGFDE